MLADIFSGCFVFLMFAVLIFFLIYGIEIFCKVQYSFFKRLCDYEIYQLLSDNDYRTGAIMIDVLLGWGSFYIGIKCCQLVSVEYV